MTSLATDLTTTPTHPFATATFKGKANIQDITNPVAPISVDGNATLQVQMTDKASPAVTTRSRLQSGTRAAASCSRATGAGPRPSSNYSAEVIFRCASNLRLD